jgi:hypothetical protein
MNQAEVTKMSGYETENKSYYDASIDSQEKKTPLERAIKALNMLTEDKKLQLYSKLIEDPALLEDKQQNKVLLERAFKMIDVLAEDKVLQVLMELKDEAPQGEYITEEEDTNKEPQQPTYPNTPFKETWGNTNNWKEKLYNLYVANPEPKASNLPKQPSQEVEWKDVATT